MRKLFIDIGGTHLRSELIDEAESFSEICSSKEVPLMAYVEEKLARYDDIGFVGIAYAGQVHEGVILSAPNIAVDEPQIKKTVAERYGVRLEIDNDLNCALLAEANEWNVQNMAALYVGTGIGAAVMEKGKVIRGSRNLAFEIGHIPYRQTPFTCGCGRNNCIELFASGSGIAKQLYPYDENRRIDLSMLSRSQIENERRVAEEFETALVHAAGTLVTLANPELIVLGGGIIEHNPYLLDRLREKIASYALGASLERLRIERSRLENAPLSGAKLLEKEETWNH